MENIKNLLEKLNEEQIKPVLDTEGAVLVIAGAGSGKTRVLTTRIAYLIAEKGASPYEIMAITFTNKAADEMKRRLEDVIGNVSGMWACTIHSMCVKILRKDIDKLGYDKNFSIYDETDKEKALKRAFEETKTDVALLKSAKNIISNAKNEILSPEECKRAYADVRFIDEICNVYAAYDKMLQRSNSLDFDDLLMKTYMLFEKFPEIADSYSERFKYIHVDEFQDTNTVQFAIIQRLSIKHGNIFVVGDDDQSIYGWRGAKIENILRFDDIYRGAKIYKLERNYRSTKKILELANCIIKNNFERRDKELWTENSDGTRIETFVASDENGEAQYVAMQIKALMSRNENVNYRDFAVFMRLNALSRAFEQEFLKYGIPYKVFGGFRFFERKEIKDILSYLKLVNNNFDDESFIRSVGTPKRGIGDKSLTELREYAAANGMSMFHAIDYIDGTTIGNSAKIKIKNFKALIENFYDFSRGNTISGLIEEILRVTDFKAQFDEKTEENDNKLMNIDEFVNTAKLFEKENGENAVLSEFLNSVTLSSDTDDMNGDNTVTIATIHAVKGLEFKNVFVAGLDENILPLARAKDDKKDLEEERRLMYVAVTRAKERIYLTRAASRYMYGRRDNMIPSRFLSEAKPVLAKFTDGAPLEKGAYVKRDYDNKIYSGGSTVSGGYSSGYAKTFLENNRPKKQQLSADCDYKAGDRVRHTKFGEGIVVSVKGTSENTVIDVAFGGIGIKSLAIKFAPMEKING